MLERLAEIEARFAELTASLADPEIAGDYRRVQELNRERSHLEGVVELFRSFRGTEAALEEAARAAARRGRGDARSRA